VEGNVDKLFADRMKKSGMSWTKGGANRIARLISLRHPGKPDTRQRTVINKPVPPVPSTSHRAEREEYQVEDGSTWLQTSMPALYEPHSDRPWAQMLRALTGSHIEGVARPARPKSQPTKCSQLRRDEHP
jgi:hypothetical protein